MKTAEEKANKYAEKSIEDISLDKERQPLVSGRSEQFGDVSENEDPPNNDKPDWNGNCWNQI